MSQEHLKLSTYVKSVHEALRVDSRILGAEKAWQKHCENNEKLQKYASAMQDLATNHWEDNYKKKDSKAVSRVDWIYHYTQEYFYEIGYLKHRNKEEEIATKLNLLISEHNRQYSHFDNMTKLNVLDVGSCYNPFKKFENFEVTAIDIAPAEETVRKCDFLNVKIANSRPEIIANNNHITQLVAESYDIVIFCLFLEYLPSPNQRLLTCEKAYELLKSEGILIIITPDSKHVGANAKIMKSWRFILSKLGFKRIKYEKLPYLHCVVFRKSLIKEIAQRWGSLQNENQFFKEIVIPQDFNKTTA